MIHLAELDEDVGPRRHLLDHRLIRRLAVGHRIERGQMIHDDAQIRDRVGQQHIGRHQRHGRIGGVLRQAGLGKQFQIVHGDRVQRDLAVCVGVEAAGADG